MRVIDIDTHVDPSMDLLLEYADPGLKARWDELTPYVNMAKSTAGGRPVISVNPFKYGRKFRTVAEELESAGKGGKGALEGKLSPFGQKDPAPDVRHDNVVGRLSDMDEEGVDIHVIIPGTWALAITALDQELAKGLYDSYHRYSAWYCGHNDERLKGLVMAPAGVRPRTSSRAG